MSRANQHAELNAKHQATHQADILVATSQLGTVAGCVRPVSNRVPCQREEIGGLDVPYRVCAILLAVGFCDKPLAIRCSDDLRLLVSLAMLHRAVARK